MARTRRVQAEKVEGMDALRSQLQAVIESLDQPDDNSLLESPCLLDSDAIVAQLNNIFQTDPTYDWPLLEPLTKQLVNIYSQSDSDAQDSIEVNSLCRLLDVVLMLSNQGKCDYSLCHSLLEDIFEVQSIEWCEKFWPFILSREAQLTKNLAGNRAPGTTVIRLCNSLLKRLSKNHDGEFSGQVAMFLARAFPLSERSGINQGGKFDVDNVTIYDEGYEMEDYSRFWLLQKYFSSPTLLFEAPQMAEFKACLDSVIALFNQIKSRRKTSRRSAVSKADGGSEGDGDDFVPKWMTHPDLFKLQLTDPGFREAVVLQILIIIAFLMDLSLNNKKKWGEIGATNRSVMYEFTLKDADASYLKSMDKKARSLLSSSLNHTVDAVMTRDLNWRLWKLQNCPKLEMDPNNGDSYEEASQNLQSNIMKPRNKYWHSMGTAALSRIWKIPTGLDRFSESQSSTELPSAESYMSKLDALRQKTEELSDETDKQQQAEAMSSTIWQLLRFTRNSGDWLAIVKRYEHLFEPPSSSAVEEGAEKTHKEDESEAVAEAVQEENDDEETEMTDEIANINGEDAENSNQNEPNVQEEAQQNEPKEVEPKEDAPRVKRLRSRK